MIICHLGDIDWLTSEWLCEQQSPPGKDGPVTMRTKRLVWKKRKWGEQKVRGVENRAFKKNKDRQIGLWKDSVSWRAANSWDVLTEEMRAIIKYKQCVSNWKSAQKRKHHSPWALFKAPISLICMFQTAGGTREQKLHDSQTEQIIRSYTPSKKCSKGLFSIVFTQLIRNPEWIWYNVCH